MTNFYVSQLGGATPGTNPNNPSDAIQTIIDFQAQSGDTIFILENEGDPVFTTATPITISKPLTIVGRENGVGHKPTLKIRSVNNGRAIVCQSSNISIIGLNIVHDPLPVDEVFDSYDNAAYTGSVVYIPPGNAGSGMDDGDLSTANVVIDDCKIHFYRSAVLSASKSLEVRNSELYCKFTSSAPNKASHILLYGMDGSVNIHNNILSTAGLNNIELVHVLNNTGDGYVEQYNGTLNITNNSVQGSSKIKRLYGSNLPSGGSGVLTVNITGNLVNQYDGNLDTVLLSENRNFKNAYQLITVANNSYTSNTHLSHFVALLPVNDPSNETFPSFTVNTPVQPRVCVHSNNVENILNIPFTKIEDNSTVYLGENDELYLQTTSLQENTVFPVDVSNLLITYPPGTYMLCEMSNSITVASYDNSYNMSGIYAYETDRLGATTSIVPPLFIKFNLNVSDFVAGIELAPGYSLADPDNNAATDDIFVYSTRNNNDGHLSSQNLQEIKWSLSNAETASVAYSDYIVNDTGVVMPINEDVRSGSIAIEVEGKSRKDVTNNVSINFSIGGIAPKMYTKYDNPYSADGVFVSNNSNVVPDAPAQLDGDLLLDTTDEFVSVQQSLQCNATLETISLTLREVNDLVHALIADQTYDSNNTIEEVRNSVANALDGLLSNNTTNVSFSVSMSTNNNSSSNTINTNSVGPTDVPVKTWVSFV
jgi:hypothetical protein